jgi:hypothetical protein
MKQVWNRSIARGHLQREMGRGGQNEMGRQKYKQIMMERPRMARRKGRFSLTVESHVA